jgi:hypothetical protein
MKSDVLTPGPIFSQSLSSLQRRIEIPFNMRVEIGVLSL